MCADWTKPGFATSWEVVDWPPTVNDGELHVWRVTVEVPSARLASLWHLLSGDERRRARGFRTSIALDHFVTARVALRVVLGGVLRIHPGELSFSRNCARCGSIEHGKPRIAGPHNIDFSISHSGEVALLAVARDAKVGVDVERIRERTDVLGLARQIFGESIRRKLQALPPAERRRSFFDLWTRQEAYAKALGMGVATVRVHDAGHGWSMSPLPVGPGYAGTVAADRELALRRWHHKWPGTYARGDCGSSPASQCSAVISGSPQSFQS